MKKVKILLLVLVTILFNLSLLIVANNLKAEGTPNPTKKGLLGNWQGKYICHCPDDTQDCWCN